MTQSTSTAEDTPRLLYNRKKNVDIFLMPSGRQFQVVADMEDAVHQMRIRMLVNHPSLRIKEIECEMLQVPDPVCRTAVYCLNALIGQQVLPGLTRELNKTADHGCTHLLNLFHDACYNLLQAQGVRGKEELGAGFPGITEEQIYKIWFLFRPEIMNSCVRYTDQSDFMERVNAAGFPRGAEKLQAVARMK